MARLTWDQPGERQYEAGVSKVVFYGEDRYGVVWNGVTSVQPSVSTSVEPLYFDGVKFNDVVTIGDLEASLKAFTYPDEFVEYEGSVEDVSGFFITQQNPKHFSLCYRTEVGDDVSGTSHYKLHILYNLTAIPADTEFPTINDNLEIIEFEWKLTSIPEDIGVYRPTSHVVFDSRKIDPYLLNDIEGILYGREDDEGGQFVVSDNGDGTWTAVAADPTAIAIDDDSGEFFITSNYATYLNPPINDKYSLASSPNRQASLPTLRRLASFVRNWQRFIVTDNGDGTWTAVSALPGIIEMIGEDQFKITVDTAAYVDPPINSKYTITSGQVNEEDLFF